MIKECSFQFEVKKEVDGVGGIGGVGCGLTVSEFDNKNIVCRCNTDICPIYQIWKRMTK